MHQSFKSHFTLRNRLRFGSLLTLAMLGVVCAGTSQAQQAASPTPPQSSVPADRLYSLSELGFVPDGYAAMMRQRDELFSATFAPLARFEIGVEFAEKFIGKSPDHPSACRGRTGLIQIAYQQDKVAAFNGFKPVEYRGNSSSCQPEGFGVITYANGAKWIGNVTASDARNAPSREWRGTTGWGALALPSGLGTVVLNSNNTFPIDIRRVATNTSTSVTPWGNVEQLSALQTRPNGTVRLLTSRTPNGPVTFLFANGGRLNTGLDAGRATRLEDGDTYVAPSGVTVKGELVSIYSSGPNMRNISRVTLARPLNGFPAGSYVVSREAFRASTADRSFVVNMANLVSFEQRQNYSPVQEDLPAMLATNLTNNWGCKEPDLVPPGWKVWWPGCVAPTASEPNGAATVFSLSGNQSLRVNFEQDKRTVTYQSGGTRIIADNFVWESGNGLVAINPHGQHNFNDGLRSIIYEGPLLGIKPDGEGTCSYREASENQNRNVVEPCSWRDGVRQDGLYIAQVRLKRLKDIAARRLEAAQREEARVIAEYEAQRAEAERQRQLAQERAAERQRQREEELARQRRNQAIAQAFAAVGQAAAQSVYETGRQQAITQNQIQANRYSQQYGRYVPPAPPPPTYQEMQRIEQIRRQYGSVYGSSATQQAANVHINRDRLRAADDSRVRQARERAATSAAEARYAEIEADRIRNEANGAREAALALRAIEEDRARGAAAAAAQAAQSAQTNAAIAQNNAEHAKQTAAADRQASGTNAPTTRSQGGYAPNLDLYLTVVRPPPAPPPPPPPIARASAPTVAKAPPPPPTVSRTYPRGSAAPR